MIGPFKMSVLKRHKILGQIEWKVTENGLIQTKQQDQARQAHIFKTLEKLNLNLYFLTDERRVFQIPKPEKEESAIAFTTRQVRNLSTHGGRRLSQTRRVEQSTRDKELKATLGAVSQWAVGKVLEGATKGDLDSNTLYEEAVRRVGKSIEGTKSDGSPTTREALILELETQASRGERYARLGLISPINVSAFVSTLRRADTKMVRTLQDILNPYIESVRAKLDALAPLHTVIQSFLTLMNGFTTLKSSTSLDQWLNSSDLIRNSDSSHRALVR